MEKPFQNGATVRGVIRGPIVWHIEPAWRSRLPNSLDELLASGQTETVKQGPFRTIYRLRSEFLDLHVKHCRPAGLRAWLREWLRPAKAILEFRKIVEVAARRIATLEPIAWGRMAGSTPGDSFLITRTLNEAAPLGRYLESELPAVREPQRSRLRQKIAVALGVFLAELHAAGVRHPDLHPGNLLLKWEGDAPQCILIDLHDAKIGGSLSERDRLNNLIAFNRWFILRSNRTDRLRFWRAYCMRAGRDETAGKSIESRTRRSNLEFWRGRESRCVRANRHFQRIAAPGVSGFAVSAFRAEEWAELIRDSDHPFQNPCRPLLKDSRSATVAEFDWTIAGTTRRVILKRFRATSIWDGPASLVRPTGALRSWKNGHAFLDGLLPTPRPLAVWHRYCGPMAIDGYLLTEKVENAMDLRRYAVSLQSLPPALSRRLHFSTIDAVARFIRLMHEQGWSHRDLKASNILVNAEGSISFIDLVGARRPPNLSFARRIRNLARLNASFLHGTAISPTDRLRFLRMYLNWAMKGRSDWKNWWRQIAAATDRKRRRNLRSGRALA